MLCCAAGMSTSLIVKEMRKIATQKGKNYEIIAMDQSRAETKLMDYDVVLIGPQLRYVLSHMQKIASKYNKPVEVIDQVDYGRCNVEAILQHAEKLYNQTTV